MSIITEALKKADVRRKPVSIVDEAIKKAVSQSPNTQANEKTIPVNNITAGSTSIVTKPETVFRPFRVPAVMQGRPVSKLKVKTKPKLGRSEVSKSWISDNVWLLIPVVLLVIALSFVGVWKPRLKLPVLTKEIPNPSFSTVAPAATDREHNPWAGKPRRTPEVAITPTALRRQFTLSGISDFGGSRSAIINDKVVETGDIVDGAKVLSITAKKVYLQSREKLFTLTLS